MILRLIRILALSFLLAFPAFSQDTFQRLYFETSYNYGFVMPHHDFMAYFIDEHVQGYQINVGLITTGEKYWHQQFSYPKFGIGYYFSGLGNREVYGCMNAFYAYFDRMFLSPVHRFNIGNKIYAGAAYITRKYDLHLNPFDLAIGSKLNVFVRYDVETSARISNHVSLKLGIGFSHASNGNFTEPNKGLNSVTVFSAFQYYLSNRIVYSGDVPQPGSDKNEVLFSIAAGKKSISRLQTLHYPVYAISAEYLHRVTSTGYAGLALTGYADPSIRKEKQITEHDSTGTGTENIRIALNAGYEMRIHHLGIVIQPGIYLKNSLKESGFMTNRLGIRYYFPSGFTVGMLIKAHWPAVADVMEWTLGYKMKK